MLLQSSRIIFSDNGSLLDLSVLLNDYLTGSAVVPIVAADDALYIAGDFPFNHRYFDVSVANDQASAVTVETWDGKEWQACVDVFDQTSIGGVTLAQSGFISWVPERQRSWVKDDTNYNGKTITGLSGVTIYDLYWVRIKFSADLKATTALKYVGHRFSRDLDLYSFHPDLQNTKVKTMFQAGKTTWDDQHYEAAQVIIRDLKSKNIALSENQILEWSKFREASCHACAEIVWRAFGKDFYPNADDAHKRYLEAFNAGIIGLDVNNNARTDSVERTIKTGQLYR